MLSKYDTLMNMIDEVPLSKTLSKALRFAQDLQDLDFEKWIRLELHGYWNSNPALTEDTIVPEYRTISGYYTDDYDRKLILSDPELGYVNEMRLRFGVTELEGLIGAKGPLSFRPLNFTELIRENLGVEVTTFKFFPNSIPTVLSAIRTKLSDHIITRKDKLVSKKKAPEVSEPGDIIEIKPNFYGIGVNLRALFRKLQSRSRLGKK